MKIFSIVAAVFLLVCETAQAMPGHGFRGTPHRLPPRPTMVFPARERPVNPTEAFVSGLVGSMIGNYLVSSYYRPDDYTDMRCFTMISRRSGQTVKKCVSVQDWLYRPQKEIYEVLYID